MGISLRLKTALASLGLVLSGGLVFGQDDNGHAFDWVSDLPIEKIKISGEFRQRLENRINYDQLRGVHDDNDFVGSRIRLNLDVKANENVSAFFQIQDSRNFGGNSVNSTGNQVARLGGGFDLHQGYVTAKVDDTTFKIGRMAMNFGEQKVVSELDWSNVGRAFDGVSMQTDIAGMVDMMIFGTKLGEDPNATTDTPDVEFHGIYNTLKLLEDNPFDVYALWNRDERRIDATTATTGEAGNRPRNTDIWNYGLSYYRKGVKNGDMIFNWGGQFDYQSGDNGPDNHRAHAWHVRAGATMAKVTWMPHFEYHYDYATGNSSATDGRSETFNQLHPLGHAYHGYIDFVGRQNLDAHRFQLGLTPMDGMKLTVDYHMFRLATKRDTTYTAAGAARIANGSAGPSKSVGTETDVTLSYNVNKYWNMKAGYSYFDSGKFYSHVRTAALGQSNAHFWWLQSTIRF